MKTGRISPTGSMLGPAGKGLAHLAGVEDYELAEAAWREAIARWPKAVIVLRQACWSFMTRP
jgi:hypothetical protein